MYAIAFYNGHADGMCVGGRYCDMYVHAMQLLNIPKPQRKASIYCIFYLNSVVDMK